jgi:hypothetical protein
MAFAGALLLIITYLTSTHHVEEFWQSYLYSFLFWSDLPLGALGLVMIYHLTGGAWGKLSRRVLEAIANTISIVAVFSIPVLIFVTKIYSWTQPQMAMDPKVLHKQVYLNPSSFTLRTIFYFSAWMTINFFLQKWSKLESAQQKTREKLRNLSAGGLVFLGFSLSFASIDWQMSVEPKWYSTVYGMVFVIGESLTAYALALAVIGFAARKTTLEESLPKKTTRDLGNILLVLVMLWAYLSFMQYLIIWSGNLPREVTWLNRRMSEGWQWIALFLIMCQFFAPFSLLLFRGTKRGLRRLAILGLFIFIIRGVDHYWMLMPGFDRKPLDFPLKAFFVWLGLGGIWFSVFLRKFDFTLPFSEGGSQ